MKTIEFKLTSGARIRAFLEGSYVVQEMPETPTQCRLVDSLHGNGGWLIADTYSNVLAQLDALNAEPAVLTELTQPVPVKVSAPVEKVPEPVKEVTVPIYGADVPVLSEAKAKNK